VGKEKPGNIDLKTAKKDATKLVAAFEVWRGSNLKPGALKVASKASFCLLNILRALWSLLLELLVVWADAVPAPTSDVIACFFAGCSGAV
jgi:hypothetical protein